MSNTGKTLLGFIAGAAAGMVVGMLFAPDKGINTRDKLSYRLDKYLDALKELLEALKEKKDEPINTAKADGQRVVGDILKEAEKIYSDMHDLEFRIKQK
ncbi:MAG: YtxH domain-containing protein [Cytophagales bacterium]|nr:YtxH domain-containing protein [Bernardetiaceae bacterium]MDW8205521.1 YtxH domain-containing protein [Cytophagales bacterium]